MLVYCLGGFRLINLGFSLGLFTNGISGLLMLFLLFLAGFIRRLAIIFHLEGWTSGYKFSSI